LNVTGTLTGDLTGNVTGNVTGNASTATALQTARTIGGVSFDGTANINLPGVNAPGNQDTTGNAATATTANTLTTTRTLWGQNFNGSANVSGSLSGVSEVRSLSGLSFASNNTTRMSLDTSGRLQVGSPFVVIQAELHVPRPAGVTILAQSTESLGNLTGGPIITAEALQSGRIASIGVTKHAGISNDAGYLTLSRTSGTSLNYWTDTSEQFRTSTTFTHIGTTSGTVVGTQTSDERVKNIHGPVEYGVKEVMALKPVKYSFKSDTDNTVKLGFIAQQTQSIVPESVYDTKEEIAEGEPTKLAMEYVALIPVLVKAMQEQQAMIEALQARLGD
jgi:hypothetical protein